MFAIMAALAAIVFICIYYWIAVVEFPTNQPITWGMNFSKEHAENLKLDWKKAYVAILEDMGVRHLKVLNQWDTIEKSNNEYRFEDTDWQLQEAQNHGATVIYVAGMKTGRWPECHIPEWAGSLNLSKEEQQQEILEYLTQTITRYRNNPTVIAWQIENEPFLDFGECPWYDKEFLKKEVALVHELDPNRQVIISDSGEASWWTEAAEVGDVVSITLYRKIGTEQSAGSGTGTYSTYDIKPIEYWYKQQLVKYLYSKPIMCGELQAEPWSFKSFYEEELDQQEKTMNVQQFKENIGYARQTGFTNIYLWGAEWMMWLKDTKHKPEIWEEAKQLFHTPA